LQIYIKAYELAVRIQGPTDKPVNTKTGVGIMSHYIPLSTDIYKYFLQVEKDGIGK
jgi:hypothetical protein